MNSGTPSIYDEHGLLYAWFEVLPGAESNDYYKSSQDEIYQHKPQTLGFGFSRIPVAGELLQVGRCLWVVAQVIHHDMSPENLKEMKECQRRFFVATIQVKFDSYV